MKVLLLLLLLLLLLITSCLSGIVEPCMYYLTFPVLTFQSSNSRNKLFAARKGNMARAKRIRPHISSWTVHSNTQHAPKTPEVLFPAQYLIRAQRVGDASDKGNVAHVTWSGSNLAGGSV